MITDKQKQLIKCMNEFCNEKFDLSCQSTKEEVGDYISRNIDEYELLINNFWCMVMSEIKLDVYDR